MSEQARRRPPLGPPWGWAAATAAAVLLAGVLALWTPFFGDAREFVASTPAPPPAAATPVQVPSGSKLCMAPVTLPTDGRIMLLRAMRPIERPRLRASVRVRGDGYRSEGRLSVDVTGQGLRLELHPPPQPIADGSVCVRNDGRRTLALMGSAEPQTSGARSNATVDGEPIVPKVALAFYTGEDGNLRDHLGDVLGHAAAFKPGGAIVLGLLGLVLLVVLPLSTVGLFVWMLRRS